MAKLIVLMRTKNASCLMSHLLFLFSREGVCVVLRVVGLWGFCVLFCFSFLFVVLLKDLSQRNAHDRITAFPFSSFLHGIATWYPLPGGFTEDCTYISVSGHLFLGDPDWQHRGCHVPQQWEDLSPNSLQRQGSSAVSGRRHYTDTSKEAYWLFLDLRGVKHLSSLPDYKQ